MLTEAEKKEIEEELHNYERREAASVEALKIIQRHRGWVPDEAIGDLAKLLGLTREEIDGVASFYPFIFRRPVGRHVIFICDSVVCWIMGYDGLLGHIVRTLAIAPGETTADGRFTLLPISCAGRCDHAPVLMIDRDLHTDLDPSKLDRVLEGYP